MSNTMIGTDTLKSDRNGVEIRVGDIATYQTKNGVYTGEIVPIMGGYAWRHAKIDFLLWDMDEEKIEVIEQAKAVIPQKEDAV